MRKQGAVNPFKKGKWYTAPTRSCSIESCATQLLFVHCCRHSHKDIKLELYMYCTSVCASHVRLNNWICSLVQFLSASGGGTCGGHPLPSPTLDCDSFFFLFPPLPAAGVVLCVCGSKRWATKAVWVFRHKNREISSSSSSCFHPLLHKY